MKLPIGNLFLFWKLFRETDFAAIENAATGLVRVAVIGETPADRQAIIEALSKGGDPVVFRAEPGRAERVVELTRTGNWITIDVGARPDGKPADPIFLDALTPENVVEAVIPELVGCLTDDELLALGRRLPVLRPVVANRLIREESTGNAQIATLTNLADVIPVLGPFVGATADLIVLTKNQVMLVYKLAAINGRPLGSKKRIAAEIAPVLGSAFLWRTIAREVAALAPFGLGILPKIVIAFTGTYLIGQIANYYYMTGRKPPKELARQFSRDALAIVTRRKPSAPAQLPPSLEKAAV